MIKMTLAALALSVGLIFAMNTTGEAACGYYGKVARIYSGAGFSYVYLSPRTTTTSSTYVYFYTTSDGMRAQAAAASGSRDTLYAYSSTGTCPTGSNSGYGGALTSLYSFPNY